MNNFYRINGLVIVCGLVLASLLLMQTQKRFETYVVANNEVIPQKNETNDVWNRHEIQDSMPLDYIVKYPTAYYNELDNKSFLDGLYKTFQPNRILVNGSEWIKQIQVDKEHIPPKTLLTQYATLIPWIRNKLNTNAEKHFKIPGDKAAPFQIIHDHWNAWSKNMLTPNRFLYNIDVVIYREAKYHAKHVRFIIITDTQNIIGVADIQIRGIIFEDKFGLFPVIQSDTTDLELIKTMPFDSNLLSSYPPILDDATIAAEVKRRDEQNAHNEKIIALLEKSPPQ